MPTRARSDLATCCLAPSPTTTLPSGAAAMPDAVDLIRAKRDGARLSAPDIGWLIDSYTRGAIADEQMSALLMAIYFNGLDAGELQAWTDSMISSGEQLDLTGLSAPTADKHSTGGGGEKESLVLGPLVAHGG